MTIVGATIFLSGLIGAFGKFLGGMISDRVGRKRVMVFALAGRALATGAFGLLALQPAPAFPAVAALFICGTFCGFLFDPACQAMVADLADPRIRIVGYSLMRIGGNLGWAIGAMVGGLIGTVSFAAMFFTTSGVTLAAALMILVTMRESLREPPAGTPRATEPVLRCLKTPGFLALGIATLLIGIVLSQLIAPLSVFATERQGLTPRQAGYFFTLNGLVIVLFQFPVAKLIGRLRLTTALIGGSLLYAIGYGCAGWSSGFWTLAACVFVVSCGELFVAPSTLSLAANLAPPEHRGRYIGVFGFFEMLGRCTGPLVGGVALDVFATRPWMHWAIVAAVGCAAAVGFALVRRRVPRENDRP